VKGPLIIPYFPPTKSVLQERGGAKSRERLMWASNTLREAQTPRRGQGRTVGTFSVWESWKGRGEKSRKGARTLNRLKKLAEHMRGAPTSFFRILL